MSLSRSAMINIECTWIWYYRTYWIYINEILSYILNTNTKYLNICPWVCWTEVFGFVCFSAGEWCLCVCVCVCVYVCVTLSIERYTRYEYTWIWYCLSDVAIAQRVHTYWNYISMIWSYILNPHEYDMIIHIEYIWIWYDHTYWIYMIMILPVGCRHRAARSYILNIHEYDMIIHIESTWIWHYPSDVAIALRERHCFEPKSCVRCLIFVGNFFQKSPVINGSFAARDLQLKASYLNQSHTLARV